MDQNEWGPGGDTRFSSGAATGGLMHEERRAAGRLADDAKAAASDAGSQAKDLAADKAEELQGMAANHLRHFANAVRTAGDELAEKDPGPISQIVRQAATGLEQFSGSMERRSPAEMIDHMRAFGRENPVGFMAGAILAGFSLARFAGSGSPSEGSASGVDRRAASGVFKSGEASSRFDDAPESRFTPPTAADGMGVLP